MCSDKRNKQVLVGINSWCRMENGIGESEYPGVFTNVLKYRSWINLVIDRTTPSIRSPAMKNSSTTFKLIVIFLSIKLCELN